MLGTGLMAQWVMAVQPQRLKLRSLMQQPPLPFVPLMLFPKLHCPLLLQAQVEVIVPPKRRPFQPHQREVLYQYFQVLLHCLEITLLFQVRVR